MVTAIPVAGQPIVQWLWGGYTVAKCGIRSYFFNGIFSINADPIAGSKIEFNHSLFDGCAGSKNTNSPMILECISLSTRFILQTDKLKLMNLSISENGLLTQKFNWQSVYGLNSSLFFLQKIRMIVIYTYISRLGWRSDEMCCHMYKDKSIQFQILKVAKRQLTFNAYSFQMLFQNTIKLKDRNNNKYITCKNVLSYRDTAKIRENNLKPKEHLKSVVTSRFFVGLRLIKPTFNRVTCRFKSEKVNLEHDNNQIFDQMVESKYSTTTNKYHKLINILSEINFLKKCYLRIKSKLGNSTPSVDGETLDGINLKWFQKISNELKNGIYKPKPSRVVHISKKNCQEKRRLVVNSPRDKIVQEGLRAILSTVYEPLFSNYSYGFRQNRGVHNAIQQVKGWKDISWLLCLDIEKCFDSINRKKLISVMKQVVDDQRFLETINKFFNAKVVDITLKTGNSIEGVPQGNILSSILSNIYLDAFDKFVESLILKFNSGKERKRNQKYRSLIDLRGSKNKTHSEKNRRLRMVRKQKITYSELNDPKFKRIKYARYADDFIVGISGDKKFAKQIMSEIKVFLQAELHLNVSEKKSSLISIVHRQAFFLGFFLKKVPKHLNPVISQKLAGKEKRARVLKRLKHELVMSEQQELKKIKNSLKRAIAKSISKNRQYREVDSDLINKVAQIVANERSTNPFFEKPFFSDSTLKTIMFASKSDIPKDVLDSFISFQKAIDSNLKVTNFEIHLAKVRGKFTDDLGQEQKVVTKQVDLPIQIYAPTDYIKQRLKTRGIISKKGKPLAFNPIIRESDKTIISWYASLARGLLSYYSCADNFYKVKSIVNYQIRWSMYHTLAKKHKMSLHKIFSNYGQEFERKEDLCGIFPLKSSVASLKKNFRVKDLLFKPFDALNQLYFKRTELFFTKCSVENCTSSNIEIHHVRALKTRFENKSLSIETTIGKRLSGWKAYMISKNRKQLALCDVHHDMLHANKLIFKDKKIIDSNLM
jgi:group II intron reverse transcriptase/maturase